MEERSLVEKNLAEAREKFQSRFFDIIREDETGIPAAVRRFQMADATRYAPKDAPPKAE